MVAYFIIFIPFKKINYKVCKNLIKIIKINADQNKSLFLLIVIIILPKSFHHFRIPNHKLSIPSLEIFNLIIIIREGKNKGEYCFY